LSLACKGQRSAAHVDSLQKLRRFDLDLPAAFVELHRSIDDVSFWNWNRPVCVAQGGGAYARPI